MTSHLGRVTAVCPTIVPHGRGGSLLLYGTKLGHVASVYDSVMSDDKRLGRGIIENKHSVDAESPTPPPSRVGMSIHAEDMSCSTSTRSTVNPYPRVCMSVHAECMSCSDLGRMFVLNDPTAGSSCCVVLGSPGGAGNSLVSPQRTLCGRAR